MKKTVFFNKNRLIRVLVSCLVFLFFMPLSIESYAADLPDKLIPGGRTTGIKLYAEGAVVTGFSSDSSPAKEGGIKVGDIIVSVDENKITDRNTLSYALSSTNDGEIEIGVMRNGEKVKVNINAVYDVAKGAYSIGASVKDTLAGIGTVTYIDPETGEYGALGHGISDPDTMSLMPFCEGVLMPSFVVSVKKGEEGTPGELVGSYEMSITQGTVERNTNCGIFGSLNNHMNFCGIETYSVGEIDDVKKGKAYILSNIKDDDIEQYDIEIVDINKNTNDKKQMLIKVTDPDLLDATGGIVQGMSGSPIIQNGKIVGAVTHVLVNDPTKGYAIFIENMLSEAEKIK